MLGPHCCTGFSPVAASGGYSPAAVCGLPTAVASLCGAWSLGVWASVKVLGLSTVVHGLSCSLACGISPE